MTKTIKKILIKLFIKMILTVTTISLILNFLNLESKQKLLLSGLLNLILGIIIGFNDTFDLIWELDMRYNIVKA